jgi:hypothetical protein
VFPELVFWERKEVMLLKNPARGRVFKLNNSWEVILPLYEKG